MRCALNVVRIAAAMPRRTAKGEASMGHAWKIGRIADIDIFIHWSFLLLPALVALESLVGGGTVASFFGSVVFLLAVFGCVVLHELGHALMARHFGIGTRGITLLPIGGVAQLERMPKAPLQELAIAAAGPAVNVVIAVSLIAGLILGGGSVAATMGTTWGTSFIGNLIWVNLILVLFNALPAFPLDGGRVLRALLALAVPHIQATRLAAGVGQVFAVGLAIIGLLTNWMLMLVALFVFFAARQEAAAAEAEWMMSRWPRYGPVPAAHAATAVFTDPRPFNPYYRPDRRSEPVVVDAEVVDASGRRWRRGGVEFVD
jgi:Zn-dependent protease